MTRRRALRTVSPVRSVHATAMAANAPRVAIAVSAKSDQTCAYQRNLLHSLPRLRQHKLQHSKRRQLLHQIHLPCRWHQPRSLRLHQPLHRSARQ